MQSIIHWMTSVTSNESTKQAKKNETNITLADPNSNTYRSAGLFFRCRGWTSRMFEKKCKRRTVSMDKSCPAVVLGKQKDWCKHRAVSMDKSCPVVVLGSNKEIMECQNVSILLWRYSWGRGWMRAWYEFRIVAKWEALPQPFCKPSRRCHNGFLFLY